MAGNAGISPCLSLLLLSLLSQSRAADLNLAGAAGELLGAGYSAGLLFVLALVELFAKW